MNVQILYATMSGHSRKIAQAIEAQIGSQAHDLKQNPQIPSCDLLFIVSGIYGGESDANLLEYIKKLSSEQIKKVALLTSSTKGSAQGTLRKTLTEAGMNVAPEEFCCKGSFLFKEMGHPNKAEIAEALAFVQKQISLVGKNPSYF